MRAWLKIMAAYRRVYDSRHLQANCQDPGSAPEPYARQSSIGLPFICIVAELLTVCFVTLPRRPCSKVDVACAPVTPTGIHR